MKRATTQLRWVWLSALTCLAVAILAGCGGSSSDSTGGGGGGGTESSTGAAPSEGGGSSGGGLEVAQQSVEEHRQPVAGFTPPGPPIDATKLSGKSLYYIPISASIPVLAGSAKGIEEAAEALGMRYDTCDGKFLPAAAAACITQAVNAKAAGIVLDSVDPAVVGPAIAAAKSAGVPVLAVGNNGPSSATLDYTTGGDAESQVVAMNWITADSGGKGNILAITIKGTRSGEESAAAGVAELEKNCPGCGYDSLAITDAQIPNIQTLTSNELARVPDAEYGFPEVDFFVPGFEAGLRQAGRTDMKVVSTNAALSQLQEVSSGGLQVADIGANRNYLGWQDVDTLLRMGLSKPLPTERSVPIRIFDETNIGELKLDEAAAVDGEWWGPTTYKEEFPKLWGVGGP